MSAEVGAPGVAAQSPPMEIAKSRWLTTALLAPADPGAVSAEDRTALRRRLDAALAATRSSPARPGPLRVDGFVLKFAAAGLPPDDEPFRWTSRNARRSIGLAAVGHLGHGRAGTPAAAVHLVLSELADDACRGTARAGSMARWLARLAPGGRTAVLAEAVTWATRFYNALDWGPMPAPLVIGGRDQWWDSPGRPAVALRGRADLRVPGNGALFTMLSGHPGPTSPVELGLPALVGALAGDGPVPTRVLGWWPDCGRALVLPVDRALLERTVDAVAGAVHLVRGLVGAAPAAGR
jgi:hypothetical protein